MSADAGQDGRDMLALVAVVKDVSARLVLAEARLDTLENPESPVDRNARALAAHADKIDAATPGKVPGYETEKLEAHRGTVKIGL